MASSSARRCSVHFGEVDDDNTEIDAHSNEIIIQRSNHHGHKTLDVHLGFLQIYHRYEISFELKHSDLPQSNAIAQRITEPPNLNCRLLQIESKPNDSIVVKFEFLASKDKVVREKVYLEDQNNPKHFTKVILEARVLGKGKGTPLLKNGIHCTGKFADAEESDVGSDWHGFK